MTKQKDHVVRGEGTPKMEVRANILDLIPKGKRGLKLETLVQRIVENGYRTGEGTALRTLRAMEAKGFLHFK